MEKLEDGSVKLTPSKLMHQLFQEYPPNQIKTIRGIPVPLRQIDESEDFSERVEVVEYLHLLGMLNYLTQSRPDLATAQSFAATHSANPSRRDLEQLLQIVKYLWDTKDKSLIIRKVGVSGSELELICYVNATYLTHPDARSHTGYCMSFGKIETFFAKSVKQQLVATSSTHAGMRALYQLILDIIFVANLCDELHRPIKLTANVLDDNQPVIDLSESLTSKHILMLVNFVREQVTAGLVEIQKVVTEDNVADLLTKLLHGQQFTDKAHYLLGINYHD